MCKWRRHQAAAMKADENTLPRSAKRTDKTRYAPLFGCKDRGRMLKSRIGGVKIVNLKIFLLKIGFSELFMPRQRPAATKKGRFAPESNAGRPWRRQRSTVQRKNERGRKKNKRHEGKADARARWNGLRNFHSFHYKQQDINRLR